MTACIEETMLILAFSCNSKNCLVLSATLSVTFLYFVPLGLRFPLIVCTSVLVHKIHPLTGIRRYSSSMNPYKFKQVGLV